jgi:hypothetical protein
MIPGKMKAKAISVLIIVLIFSSFPVIAEQEQPAGWKGKIGKENGIRSIKNPEEPLYGEISFELEEDLSIGREDDENYMFYDLVSIAVDAENNIFVLDRGNTRIQKYDRNGNYLQTIGRKGQGPGEFLDLRYMTMSNINLDAQGNLCVKEQGRRLHIFDKNANFKNVIHLSMNIGFPFGMTKDGNIQTQAMSGTREKMSADIVLLNSEGRKIKTIASYPIHLPPRIRGRIILHNPYTPGLMLCLLNTGQGIYGYSQEYRLFVFDSSGEVEYFIEKNEPPRPIKKDEKNKLMDRYMESQRQREQGLKLSRGEVKKGYIFPEHRPFFKGIIKDDKDRIYVLRFKSPLDKEKNEKYDLFSREGYYLYKVTMPSIPFPVIKDGYIYTSQRDKDTGISRVIRYRIKNWDKIETQ